MLASEACACRLQAPVAELYIFSPQVFHFFPTKFTFSPGPPLFFPISVTTLTNSLTYPSTLGGHTLNVAVRFMT